MQRISLIALFVFLSTAAFADEVPDATKARVIYNPKTMEIDRIIHVDHDADLAPHRPNRGEKLYDIPIPDYDKMTIQSGSQAGWPDKYKIQKYLIAHLPVS